MSYKRRKEKGIGLIRISLCNAAEKQTAAVPQVGGMLCVFVLSKAVVSKSMFTSHKISQAVYKGKGKIP